MAKVDLLSQSSSSCLMSNRLQVQQVEGSLKRVVETCGNDPVAPMDHVQHGVQVCQDVLHVLQDVLQVVQLWGCRGLVVEEEVVDDCLLVNHRQVVVLRGGLLLNLDCCHVLGLHWAHLLLDYLDHLLLTLCRPPVSLEVYSKVGTWALSLSVPISKGNAVQSKIGRMDLLMT